METDGPTTPKGSPPVSPFLRRTSVTADHISISEIPAPVSDSLGPQDPETAAILEVLAPAPTVGMIAPFHNQLPGPFSLEEVEDQIYEMAHALPSITPPGLPDPERIPGVVHGLAISTPPERPVPERRIDSLSLDIDARMRETIEERRRQARDKGVLAMARFRLTHPPNTGQDTGPAPTAEALVDPKEVDWAAETESLGDDEAQKK